jgi:hypothetical protein
MRISFSLSAAQMARLCQRLKTRVPDLSVGDEFVAFNIATKNVKITAGKFSEKIAAKIQSEGRASVPCTVFYGVMSTLPYFRERTVEICFDEGKMSVDEMVFHNRMITLSAPPFAKRPQNYLKRGSFVSSEAA